MSSILVTIPDQVASAFINHLAKLEPRIANQITIRVLEDETQSTKYEAKIPGPGEFRGEGQWQEVNEEDYESLKTYLPTRTS